MDLQLNPENGLHVMGVAIAHHLIQLRPKTVAVFTMSLVERCTREQFRIDVTLLQRLQNLMGIDHHYVDEFVLKFVGLLLNTE